MTANAGGSGPAPAAGGMTENVANALCYLLGMVTGILFLVIAPYNQNPRTRFHAFQSIFLNIAWIVFWVVFTILLSVMAFISSTLALVLSSLYGLIGLAGFGLAIFLMWRAYNNEPLVLPVIGPMAQKQAGKQ